MRIMLLFLIVPHILMGCASMSRYERGNLVAFGEKINEEERPLYYLLRVENPDGLDSISPEFFVKLSPDAEPVRLNDLKPDYAAKYLERFEPPPQWPQKLKEKALLYDSYEGNGFYVSFSKGRLHSFGACSSCGGMKNSPVFGKDDGSVFRELPLTFEQMVEIFGSPDHLYKVREVTY